MLFFDVMRHNPAQPSWPERDRFLLSKGHAALIQYAALAESGYFPIEELATLKQLGSRLQGHPDLRKLPGIEANTGSLGQGLSIAGGMAAGLRLQGVTDAQVYCILGDGEQSEGQVWEAAMSAAAFGLGNLTAFVDHNGLQATGPTRERFPIEALPEKWAAFGWHVQTIDGHNIDAIRQAIRAARTETARPSMIIADTVKGKGIPFAENVASFHNGMMTEAQYTQAVEALGGDAL